MQKRAKLSSELLTKKKDRDDCMGMEDRKLSGRKKAHLSLLLEDIWDNGE